MVARATRVELRTMVEKAVRVAAGTRMSDTHPWGAGAEDNVINHYIDCVFVIATPPPLLWTLLLLSFRVFTAVHT